MKVEIKNPRFFLSVRLVGDEVTAKIVDFNMADKKISLSVKALLEPEDKADEEVADVDIEQVAAEE